MNAGRLGANQANHSIQNALQRLSGYQHFEDFPLPPIALALALQLRSAIAHGDFKAEFFLRMPPLANAPRSE